MLKREAFITTSTAAMFESTRCVRRRQRETFVLPDFISARQRRHPALALFLFICLSVSCSRSPWSHGLPDFGGEASEPCLSLSRCLSRSLSFARARSRSLARSLSRALSLSAAMSEQGLRERTRALYAVCSRHPQEISFALPLDSSRYNAAGVYM